MVGFEETTLTDLKGELASLRIDRDSPARSPWRWPLLLLIPVLLALGVLYALRARDALRAVEVETASATLTSGVKKLTVKDKTRQYTLQLPATYDPTHPYRVVFGWHGANDNMDVTVKGSLVQPAGSFRYFGLQPLAPAREQYHRRSRRDGLHRIRHLASVHIGHAQIGDDRREFLLALVGLAKALDAFAPAVGGHDGVAVGLERVAQ